MRKWHRTKDAFAFSVSVLYRLLRACLSCDYCCGPMQCSIFQYAAERTSGTCLLLSSSCPCSTSADRIKLFSFNSFLNKVLLYWERTIYIVLSLLLYQIGKKKFSFIITYVITFVIYVSIPGDSQTRSWATCSAWPCFEQRGWTGQSPEAPSTLKHSAAWSFSAKAVNCKEGVTKQHQELKYVLL